MRSFTNVSHRPALKYCNYEGGWCFRTPCTKLLGEGERDRRQGLEGALLETVIWREEKFFIFGSIVPSPSYTLKPVLLELDQTTPVSINDHETDNQ